MKKHSIMYSDLICDTFPSMLKNIAESEDNCSPRLKATVAIDMVATFKKHKRKTLEAYFFMISKRYYYSYYDYTNELGQKINQILESDPDCTDELTEQDILDIISMFFDINNVIDGQSPVSTHSNDDDDDDDQSKQILILQNELKILKEESKKLKKSENPLLEEENDKLKEENGKVKEELDKLKGENDKLKGENDKLKEENGKLEEENDKHKEENDKLKEENDKLKEENDKIKDKNDKLKEELDKLKEENGKLKEELDRVNDQNEKLQQSKDDADKIITSLDNTIRDKDAQIKILEDKHSKDLNNYKAQFDIQIQNMKADYDKQIQSNQQKCNEEIIKAKNKFEEDKKKIEEECKNEKVAAQKKYNDDIAIFMDDINSKYAQLENANKKNIDKLNNNCEALSQKNTKLKEQVDNLTKKLAKQTENFNQINDELIASRKEKLSLADNKRYLIRKYNELGANYNDIKSRLSYLLEDRKSLMEKNEELKNQIKDHEALEQLPSEKSIKIYDDYCTEIRLNELEEQVNEILKNEPGKGHNETINIITAEMKMILQQFHSLLVKYNKSVPKKYDEFYERFLPKDADGKRELLETYVNNCKP